MFHRPFLSAETVPTENLKDPKIETFANTKLLFKNCKGFQYIATFVRQNHCTEKIQWYYKFNNPPLLPFKLSSKYLASPEKKNIQTMISEEQGDFQKLVWSY